MKINVRIYLYQKVGVHMNTNFFPIKVYSLNYNLYSSRSKAFLTKKINNNQTVDPFYAVLNLRQIKNIELRLSILDIDIDKYKSLDHAINRCKELMYMYK